MKIKFALCMMLAYITSAVAAGQQVSVNYNHSQSFSSYHTYAWGSNNTNQIQNSILAQAAQQDMANLPSVLAIVSRSPSSPARAIFEVSPAICEGQPS
jgi:hypothetical protein